MVRYLYSCSHCCSQFEVEKNMTAVAKPESCPACGQPASRVFTVPGISRKGSEIDFNGCGKDEESCAGCDNPACDLDE